MFVIPSLLSTLLTFYVTMPLSNTQYVQNSGVTFYDYQQSVQDGRYYSIQFNSFITYAQNVGGGGYWDSSYDGVTRTYDMPIARFRLLNTDSDPSEYVNDYITASMYYEVRNNIIVPNSAQLSFSICDIESIDYPKLNYDFYSTIQNQGAQGGYLSTIEDGYGLIHLYHNQNFPTIDVPDHYLNNIITIYFVFKFIQQDIYDIAVSEITGDQYASGYQLGYENGYRNGSQQGVNDFKNSQEYSNILSQEYESGKQVGIGIGRQQVIDSGQTASIIFNGIISIGLLPTNVFLKMLNFEVFGINIGALVSSLLTILVIIIISRMLFGGKSGSE